jgi:hypothetical protein
MGIQYTDIFHSKALQNLPTLGFLVSKIYHLATRPEIPSSETTSSQPIKQPLSDLCSRDNNPRKMIQMEKKNVRLFYLSIFESNYFDSLSGHCATVSRICIFWKFILLWDPLIELHFSSLMVCILLCTYNRMKYFVAIFFWRFVAVSTHHLKTFLFNFLFQNVSTYMKEQCLIGIARFLCPSLHFHFNV